MDGVLLYMYSYEYVVNPQPLSWIRVGTPKNHPIRFTTTFDVTRRGPRHRQLCRQLCRQTSLGAPEAMIQVQATKGQISGPIQLEIQRQQLTWWAAAFHKVLVQIGPGMVSTCMHTCSIASAIHQIASPHQGGRGANYTMYKASVSIKDLSEKWPQIRRDSPVLGRERRAFLRCPEYKCKYYCSTMSLVQVPCPTRYMYIC